MKKIINNILLVIGILLILMSIAAVVMMQVFEKSSAENAENYVLKLHSLMPEAWDAFHEERSDMTMPAIELDGYDFIGILEIPAYDAALPVCSVWDKDTASTMPCRYAGSIYNGTLVIGGSSNKGQFDFMKLISIGDTVFLTDMTGAKFTCTVENIEITEDVSNESLTSYNGLTFYARNSSGSDYTVVRCSLG